MKKTVLALSVVVLSFLWSVNYSYGQGGSFASVTNLQSLAVSANTGEKPQSKVWMYDNRWWAALLTSSGGTNVYRLDGTLWTNVLHLSDATDAHADAKVVGSVVHILLYRGVSSSLVSVEYVPVTHTYQLWSTRTSTVSLTLDSGVETATIDVDGTGRIWLASDAVTDVNVRWSDSPYSTWSSPITIGAGINADDISVVTALPALGKVGVLWSNQNTQRFGFKTHADGADPATWSADEVPASQSALNVGAGMADDHLHVAVASDGTLYAAVKTSYDTPGYPKIALLIRRPGGTWDNLYEVDQTGTRGIVLLNEARGKLTVCYTQSEGANDIVYRQTDLSAISFSPRQTLIAGGTFNEPSSTKQNYTNDVVILASNTSNSSAVGVLATSLSGDGSLVAYYKMDEGSGTSLWDSSGTGNHGTINGTAAWASGSRGQALVFDGSTTYVTVSDTPSLRITNAITLATWVRPSVYATQDMVKKATNGSVNGYELSLASASGSPPRRPFVRFNQQTSGDTYRLSARVTSEYPINGTWVHYAATYDGTTIKFYINGVLDTTKTASITIASNNLPLSIGAESNGGRKFTGRLDEVKVFNRALSAEEILALVEIPTHTITASADTNGNISPSGAVTVIEGTNKSFTITPITGYSVDSLIVDGGMTDSTTSYTFYNVTSDHTIRAVFASIPGYTLRFAAIADYGINNSNEQSVANLVNNLSPDIVITQGDNSYNATPIDDNIGKYYSNYIGSYNGSYGSGSVFNRFFPSLGNHDHTDGGGLSGYLSYFTLPGVAISSSNTSGNERYYDYIVGPVHFFVLDSDPAEPDGWTSTSAQAQWLQAQLASSTSTWKIVHFHQTPYTSGYQHGPTTEMRWPFQEWGATAVISSHEHNYERILKNGFPYFVCGTGGNGLYGFNSTPEPGSAVRYNANYGSMLVEANTDSITFKFYSIAGGVGGTLIDQYIIKNISFTITSSAGANGTISPSGAVSVNYGGSQTFTITPNPGYHVDSLLVDGVYAGTGTVYTFTNVVADHSINAKFASAGTSGLVGWWPMDEGSGTTLVDSSSYHNHGTIAGTPSWVSGVHGQALVFNGTSTYATVPDTPSLRITNSITLAAWVKPGVYATQDLIKKATNGSVDGYELSLASASGNPPRRPFVRFNQATNGDTYRLSARVTSEYPVDGTWIHLAATYDGATIRMYINGVLDTIKATSIAIASNSLPLSVGAESNGGRKYTGQMDDARVYNYALSASEIQALMTWTHTITATAGAHGSVSPSGAIVVNDGASQSFAIAADPGYHIDSVLVDGVKVDSTTSYTFVNVTTNHTIRAVFWINQYTITASAGANGTISPNGAVGVNHGSSQAFTITPATGYHVDSLLVDEVKVDSTTSYTFVDVTTGHTIRAVFRINQYTITASAGANGTISPSGAVGVNHGSSQAFTITPATGYHVDSLLVDEVKVDSTTSYTFENVTTNHTIRVVFRINQYTITASAGANGTISPSGGVNVNHGSTQAFVIAPSGGYHVDSVLVDDVKVDSTTSYTFVNVTTNHTIRAVFRINQYTITASAGPNGTISPSGAVNVNYGSTQAFAIAPSGGYHVDSVLVDGVKVDSTTSYTFENVTTNHTIRAVFRINQYTITASAGANGTISPSGGVNVNHGSTQAFVIAPSGGYHVDSVLVDDVKVDSTTSYTFVNVTTNHTIRAVFRINQYTITASAGPNGTISPSGAVNVNYGSTQAFAIAPSGGYHVDSVLVDGVKVDSTTSYTFENVTTNHTIRAVFRINQYTITASAGANGTISPSGGVNVNHGSSQAFTITPATGYHVDSLLVDEVKVDSTTSYTFENVTTNHTIRVVFRINQYTITASAGANGTISPSGGVNVNHGSTQAFVIAPSGGYHVDSVLVDDVKVDSTTSYTFVNVTTNHTIRAVFRINQYTITASAGPNGTISPSGAVNVNYGSTQAFAIAPSGGYHVDSVLVDGVKVDSTTSYTFENVTTNHTIRAVFRINQYTITASAGANGTISPSGGVNVNHGSTQAFVIAPSGGYHVDSVLVDDVKVDSTTSYTFVNVTTNHTIRAVFRINQYTITASAGPNGTISPSGAVSVNHGSSQTFAITPSGVYHVDSVLVDGVKVDSTTSYTFVNVTTNHTIRAVFAISPVTITVGMSSGWNMISCPVTVANDSVRALYPTAAFAYAFAFNGGYVQDYTMDHGRGYWESFASPVSQPVTGLPRASDSISVEAGWNMVGTISNPVDTNTIVSVPSGLRVSSWFGYSGGYDAVTQLVPGLAYWVKSIAAGKFVLANPTLSRPAKVQSSGVREVGDLLNTISITDSRGGSQTLYFGTDANREIAVSFYSMPPAPPTGSFDARFATADGGTMVQIHPAKVSNAVEFPVTIQSTAYPVTVTWKVGKGTASYELTDGVGGSVFHTREMNRGGSIKITNSGVNRISVKVIGDGQLPKEFALSQNYPNPFNPSTTIRYALPVQTHVMLKIYNILGQEVKTLINEVQEAGYRLTEWNSTDNSGQTVGSGTYFCRLTAGGFVDTKKLLLVK